MTRVKRGLSASKRRKNVLHDTKGYRWHRKTHYRAAKEAAIKAGSYAYRDRRAKKRVMRSLWIIRLNNALRLHGLRYNLFIKSMMDKGIAIDRKVFSQLAMENPQVFSKLIKSLQ